MTCKELEKKYGVPTPLIRQLIKYLGIPLFVGRGGNQFTEADFYLLDVVLDFLASSVKKEGSWTGGKKKELLANLTNEEKDMPKHSSAEELDEVLEEEIEDDEEEDDDDDLEEYDEDDDEDFDDLDEDDYDEEDDE